MGFAPLGVGGLATSNSLSQSTEKREDNKEIKIKKMKQQNPKEHYFNVQQKLYSNKEITINDKFVLGYILSIYESTGIFYMSDKTLSNNLGTTIKIIRTTLNRLKKFDWFHTDTKANIGPDKKYGGKTRFINIDIDMLNKFLSSNPTPQSPTPKKDDLNEVQVIAKVSAPEIKETPTEAIETSDDPITGITNNFDVIIPIDSDLVNYYNEELVKKRKFTDKLRTYKYKSMLNDAIRERKKSREQLDEILNNIRK